MKIATLGGKDYFGEAGVIAVHEKSAMETYVRARVSDNLADCFDRFQALAHECSEPIQFRAIMAAVLEYLAPFAYLVQYIIHGLCCFQ